MYNSNTPIPEITKRELVHQGFFDVYVDLLQLPHGPKRPYTVIDIKVHAVSVIAVTQEGKLVINQEYRHPTGKWLLSLPGGRIDTGESPIEAARRELLEESGYGDGKFSLLGDTYPFPALTDQQIFYVLAQDVKLQQPPSLEEFELIHSQLKTVEELSSAIRSGYEVDGVLCTGLFLWQMRSRE